MQGLCQLDVQGSDFLREVDAFVADEFADEPVDASIAADAAELIRRTWARREYIDGLLNQSGAHWDVGRMALVDRNITRVGVCELLERLDVAPAIVIDEAIEIARQYGSSESPRFVNGVLDAVRRRLESESGGS